jgi:hypothetical protein
VLAQALYDALESQNREQILAAQENLSIAAEALWASAESRTDITAREKGILRLLAGAAIKELPEKTKDPANHTKIKQDLRLLKSSLALL